jgi:hypothetical protein
MLVEQSARLGQSHRLRRNQKSEKDYVHLTILWTTTYAFISSVTCNSHCAYCRFCRREFGIGHGGESDLKSFSKRKSQNGRTWSEAKQFADQIYVIIQKTYNANRVIA